MHLQVRGLMAKLSSPQSQKEGLATQVVQGMRYYVLPLPLQIPQDCTILARMAPRYRQRVLAALHMVRHVPVELTGDSQTETQTGAPLTKPTVSAAVSLPVRARMLHLHRSAVAVAHIAAVAVI
jgi:hypothetical protein